MKCGFGALCLHTVNGWVSQSACDSRQWRGYQSWKIVFEKLSTRSKSPGTLSGDSKELWLRRGEIVSRHTFPRQWRGWRGCHKLKTKIGSSWPDLSKNTPFGIGNLSVVQEWSAEQRSHTCAKANRFMGQNNRSATTLFPSPNTVRLSSRTRQK